MDDDRTAVDVPDYPGKPKKGYINIIIRHEFNESRNLYEDKKNDKHWYKRFNKKGKYM